MGSDAPIALDYRQSIDCPAVIRYHWSERAERATIVHVDEASFRQSPTLHQTWAARNSQPRIPARGERNTQKILGAVALSNGQFVYRHQTEYFNARTYPAFIAEEVLPAFYRRGHRVFLIHDNASYHKNPEVYQWFAAQRQ